MDKKKVYVPKWGHDLESVVLDTGPFGVFLQNSKHHPHKFDRVLSMFLPLKQLGFDVSRN